MLDVVARPEAGLGELLTERARAASARRLALDLLLGAAVTLTAGLARPPFWPLLGSAALCFVAYGAWGIADRRMRAAREPDPLVAALRGPGHAERAWRAACGLAVLVGTLAAAGVVFSAMFGVLGTWIS